MALRSPHQVHQYGGSNLLTAPATEPVTAAELQDHLRADSTVLPDAEAEDLITRARLFIEQDLGIAMIDQTWQLTLDHWFNQTGEVWWDGVRDGSITMFGLGRILCEFPRYPLSSVTQIDVYYNDDSATTYTSGSTPALTEVFQVDASKRPGRLALRLDASPPTLSRPLSGIDITYVAGYGSSADDVPVLLKRAILQTAAYMYVHRGDGCEVTEAWAKSGAKEYAGLYGVVRI